jgi:hypothetical protein
MADVPSGLSFIPPRETKKKLLDPCFAMSQITFSEYSIKRFDTESHVAMF